MKKIFTLTILSSMFLLMLIHSCSKKSDDTTTTPTPTPTPTVTYPDSNTIIVDGAKQELFPAFCSLSGGSSNLYTMNASNGNNDYKVIATTYGTPGATKLYTVTISPTPAADQIQVILAKGVGSAALQYVAVSGSVQVTVVSGLGIKTSFTDLVFRKTSYTDIKASATMICQ